VDGALEGRTVLITGVARGLGLDLALECLERGARLVGTVRNEASLARLRALLPNEAPVQLLVADLSTPGALVEALGKAAVDPGSLRLALLCAGVKHDGATVLALRELRDTFEVNFFAAAEFAQWFCRPSSSGASTPPAGQRSLTLISSMGRWHGMHSTAGYNASKAALSIWGESLEMDLARSGGPGVALTIVEPGLFESGMVARRRGLRGLLLAQRRSVAERIVEGALAGRRVLRPPAWFAWLTWAVCAAGRDFRHALLSRARR
jgi:NAD(P)-dependent dehydrogenase (short-subunit alcohol dehydrogenase family)